MTPYRGTEGYFKGEIPWITSGELNYNIVCTTKEYITKKAVIETNLKIYPPLTFFIAITGLEAPGTRGKCALNGVFATTNQSCMAFESVPELETLFLFFWYIKYGTSLYFKFAQGTKQQSFNNSIVEKFVLIHPSLPEQQKIAAFLSAIDTRIQQLTRKKALLEQYKKGVMQQIFSQQIRFKNEQGRDFPEWEEKRLGEVGKVVMGQSPDSASYNDKGNGIYLIQGNADLSCNKTAPRVWTTQPTKQCEVGDIILSVRAPVGAVALSIHSACLGRGVAGIKTHRFCETEFIFQWLLWFEPKWVRLEQGSTFTAINGKDIQTLKVYLPSLPEQQKIASFLSALDVKIDQMGQQLVRMQAFKKGLLQQLFV